MDVPHPTDHRHLPWTSSTFRGAGIAAAACALSVLSFFALPYTHLYGRDFTAAGWIASLIRIDPGVTIVFLIPLLTAVAGLIAVFQVGPSSWPSSRLRTMRLTAILLSVVVAGHLLDIVIHRGLSSYRFGFWVEMLSVVAAIAFIGSDISRLTSWRRETVTSHVWR